MANISRSKGKLLPLEINDITKRPGSIIPLTVIPRERESSTSFERNLQKRSERDIWKSRPRRIEFEANLGKIKKEVSTTFVKHEISPTSITNLVK
ncbi:hypothetical protein V1477_007749 [Vespula maculifrons]|uniref:Uncharacterized protein n=1 Tax=Vespula maculifrons TaxID=7453 RepID=A0ABD2CFM4_VESMC